MMHPYQRNHGPYSPHYYPNVPPQMKMDPARFPGAYEWPWDANYGYPYPVGPVQCHGCCNHNYFPGNFMLRPPYPHVPPPQSHWPGYPAVPGAYPVQYFPPHCTMEIPRYEYDKDTPAEHHCCGCPNHPCSRKEANNLKIEEEEPGQVEAKGNQSVVPFELKNCSYPVVWLPPGYMKGKEKSRGNDSESRAWDRSPQGTKSHERSKSFGEQPSAQSLWFPVDASNLGSIIQGDDQKRSQNNQDAKAYENSKALEDKPTLWNGWSPIDTSKFQHLKRSEDQKKHERGQNDKQHNYPFPIFWIPYKPEVSEREEPNETSIKGGSASDSESTPVVSHDINGRREGNIKDEAPKLADKNKVQRTIPVKQVAQNVETNALASNGEKTADTGEKVGEKKSSEDGAKRQSSSPRKSSKLPPVCLRVDPLPKKGVNGHSRSPSPPGDKGKSHDSSGQSSTMQEKAKEGASAADTKAIRDEEVEQKQGKVKSVEVSEGMATQEGSKKVGLADAPSSAAEKPIGQLHKDTTGGDQEKAYGSPEEKSFDKFQDSNMGPTEMPSTDTSCKTDKPNSGTKETVMDGSMRMKLSEEEAAVLIQSAFRGFEVRKWEPLKKLKQLAKIKEQMGEIKNRIKALESSPDTSNKDKQRTIISEMITTLLLKLDTIQGVHSSIRDIRKSVAKELVSLQDTLDQSIKKHSDTEPLSVEPSRNQFLNDEKVVSESSNAGILISGKAGGNLDEKFAKLAEISSMSRLDPAMEVGSADDACRMGDPVMMDTPRDHEGEVKESVESQLGGGEPINAIEMTDSLATDKSVDEDEGKIDTLENEVDLKEIIEEVIPVSKSDEMKYLLLQEHQNLPIADREEMDEGREQEINEEVGSVSKSDEMKDLLLQESENLPIADHEETQGCQEQEETLGAEVLREVLPELCEKPVNQQEVPESEVLGDLVPELHEIPIDEHEIPETEILGDLVPEHEQEVPETAAHEEVPELHDVLEHEQDIPLTEVLGEEIKLHETPIRAQDVPATEVLPDLHETLVHEQATSAADFLPELYKTLVNVQAEEKGGHVPPEAETKEEPVAAGNASKDVSIGSNGFSGQPNEEVSGNTDGSPKASLEESQTAEMFGELSASQALDGSISRPNSVLTSDIASEVPVGFSEEHDAEDGHYCGQLRHLENNTATVEHEKASVDKDNIPPSSPTASLASYVTDTLSETDRKLIEENEKMREMMQTLLEAGNKQLATISSLSGRVEDLEKKLSKKRRLKIKRPRTAASGSLCLKTSNTSMQERPVGLAM